MNGSGGHHQPFQLPPLSWPDQAPGSGSVTLRPFTDADLPLVVELSTDSYIAVMATVSSPCTEEAGRAYLHRQQQRHVDGVGFSFAVVETATGQAVGTAGLWLDQQTPRASAGYSVAPPARGRGYARAALAALTAFAWTLPWLRQVELFIEPWNAASVRVAQHCGYTFAGTVTGQLPNMGRYPTMSRYVLDRPQQQLHPSAQARPGRAGRLEVDGC